MPDPEVVEPNDTDEDEAPHDGEPVEPAEEAPRNDEVPEGDE